MNRPSRSLLLAVLACAGCGAGTIIGGRDAADVARLDAADRAVSDASPNRDATSDAAFDALRDGALVDAPSDLAPDLPPPVDAPVDTGPMHVCPSGGTPDCSPGPGTGNADQCHDAPSCYLSAVQRAIHAVIADHPEWFAYNDMLLCSNVLNVDGYFDAVVANLNASGLCAIRDPNAPSDEIVVKFDNDFAEDFDILASTGCARYGSAIYTGYCAPAWF